MTAPAAVPDAADAGAPALLLVFGAVVARGAVFPLPVGPVEERAAASGLPTDRWCLYRVDAAWVPASLDEPDTRAAVERDVFSAWLAALRAAAP